MARAKPRVLGFLAAALTVPARRVARTDVRPATPVALVLVAFAGLTALAALAMVVGTNPDEEYALSTTAHGLGYALRHAVTFELQAPLWFGLVALWRLLDGSVYFARLFSVGCVVATCFALRAVAVRVRPEANPIPFVALVALNPFVVYAALEIRLYACALLLTSLMWVAFYDGFLFGEKRSARILFVSFAVAGIYVLYFVGFALAGGLAALLVARRFRAMAAYLAACAVVVALASPAVWLAASQATVLRGLLAGSSALPLRLFSESVAQFVLPYSYRWYEEPGLGAWLIAYKIATVLCVAALIAGRPRLDRRAWALVAMPIGIWLAYWLAYEVTRVQYEVPRHFVVLFIPLMAAAYAVLGSLRGPALRRGAVSLASLYAIFAVATLWTTYRHLAKPGDWGRVGSYLNARVVATDVVAVFAPDALPALRRAYRGPAPLVAFPRPGDLRRYDPAGYEVESEDAALRAIRTIAAGRRMWLVIYGPCAPADVNYGCQKLERALSDRYSSAPIEHFYDNEVVEVK